MEDAKLEQVRALEKQIQAKAERSEAARTASDAAPAPEPKAAAAKDAPAGKQEPDAAKAAPKGEAKATPADDAAPVRDAGNDDESEDAAAPEHGDDDPTAKPPKKKGGFKKRIAEITREKHAERLAREAAEQERDYLRSLVQQHQQQTARPAPNGPQHVQANADGKPTLEQYGYDQDAYEAARDAWVIGQAEKSFLQRQQQAEQQRKQQERVKAFQGRIAEFEKEVPGGWQEAVSAPIQFTPPMLEVISTSPIGPHLGHYLAQHLDEAHQITQLAPYAQQASLARIEAQLLATREAAKAAPAPIPAAPRNTVSKAPAPAPVIPSGSAGSTPVDKWDIGDHIAAVQAKRKAKLGA